MIFFSCRLCFGSELRPSLEGRIIKVKEENSLLSILERKIGIPSRFYQRLEFKTGEEPYINVGINTKIIPYYAKIKYLLDLEDRSSPYYLFSAGVNLVEGEDVTFNKFLDDLGQRVNYGIGVGIDFKNIELEVLYGKYNYQNIGVPQQEKKSLYSSTKVTFGCKYRF